MLFEKSNATNFGNQRRQTLEIKIVIREIKGDKFKIKMTQQKPKGFFLLSRQDIKIKENKKRIRHGKFYL